MRRVQLSRARDWRMPPNTVKVDRSTKWGNPYRIGEPVDQVQLKRWGWKFSKNGLQFVTPSAQIAVRKFAHALFWDQAIHDHVRDRLGGKDLACWCKRDEPCHADVLLWIANSKREDINQLAAEIDAAIFALPAFGVIQGGKSEC